MSASTDTEGVILSGLNKLRTANKLTDVTLVVEGHHLKAHRVVLAASSDYFLAMFADCAMIESRKEEIALYGVTARAIGAIIDFIYTSRLELNVDNIEEMLAAATHVQVKAVIERCTFFLEHEIGMDNCLAIASLAEIYGQSMLIERAYRYMCGHFKDFSSSSDFKDVKLDQLRFILSCNYPIDVAEEELVLLLCKYAVHQRLDTATLRDLLRLINWQYISFDYFKTMQEFNNNINNNNINNNNPCELNDGNTQEPEIDDSSSSSGSSESSASSTLSSTSSLALAVVATATAASDKQQQLPLPRSFYYLLKQEYIANMPSDGRLTAEKQALDQLGLTNMRGMELSLLKIGGFEWKGLTNEIMCFSPSKMKWYELTSIPHIEQCNYGTAVLNNELFIVGGAYDVCLKEYIHPFGFRYCPMRDIWMTIAPIQLDRCRFSLNAVGKQYLYAVGGIVEHDIDNNDSNDNDNPPPPPPLAPLALAAAPPLLHAMSNVERYDVLTNSWTYLPSLQENRSQHAGVVVGDKLYISGGIYLANILASMWCLDTKTETWMELAPMPTPCCDHILVAVDQQIYACGGWHESLNETRVLVQHIYAYDINTNVWRVETKIPSPKFYSGVTALRRTIFFVGGLDSTESIDRASSETMAYDLDTKDWWHRNDWWDTPNDVWESTCATIYCPSCDS